MKLTSHNQPIAGESGQKGPFSSLPRPSRSLTSALSAVALMLSLHTAFSQTTILAPQPGGGTLPAGWTSENNVTTNAISQSTYWLVDPGSPGDFIISNTLDLSAYNSVTVDVNVATFGGGANNALRVEYSTDDGTTWNPTSYTTATPTSSSHIAGGPVTIPATFTATSKLRFSASTTGGRGVRIRQLGITATTVGPDTTPPVISTRSPGLSATDVAIETSISITFDETVIASTGTVHLFQEDGVVDIEIPIGTVDVSGATVTFAPISFLDNSTSYYVLIDADAFTDTATAPNAFTGISSETEWTFTTIGPDLTSPTVISVVPADTTTGVSLTPSISFVFDEFVSPGSTGLFYIKKVSDDSIVTTFDANDTLSVLIFNASVTATLSSPLPHNTALYLDIPATAFKDVSPAENDMVAFTSTFTTVDVPLLGLTAYTQGFTGFSAANPALPLGWSLSGPVTGFNTSTSDQVWGAGFSSGLRGGADLLGFQHTGSTGFLVKKLTLVNDTGAEITDLTVSYVGRRERVIEARSPIYTVNVAGTEVAALSYSTLDPDGTTRAASVSGLSIPNGVAFEITWTSDRGLPSGSSKQIGLTSVSVSAGATLFPPALSGPTLNPASLTSTAAEVSADVTSDAGSAITERGFVFALTAVNPNPELGGTGVTTIVDATTDLGLMTTSLSGLTASTGYTIRGYATNGDGTGYTPALDFTTLAPPPSFTGNYDQYFDGFEGTLPAGWTAISDGGVNGYAGPWGPSTSSGGLLGGLTGPGVLGYQHTSTTGIVTVTLTLQNNTGSALTELYVKYLGKVERATQARTPAWTVTVAGVADTDLDYSTAVGVDQTKGKLVTGLSIPDGDTFTITWVCDRGQNVPSGSSRQIGITNVLVATEEPAAGYSTWAENNNIPGALPDDDADLDGIANLVEYGLGLDPTVPDASPGTFDGTTLTFTKGAEAIANGDVTFSIEVSTTLGESPDPWTPASVTEVGNTISYSFLGGPTKNFARLVVSPVAF